MVWIILLSGRFTFLFFSSTHTNYPLASRFLDDRGVTAVDGPRELCKRIMISYLLSVLAGALSYTAWCGYEGANDKTNHCPTTIL